MKKRLILLLAMCLSISLTFGQSTFYVNIMGNDSTGNGSQLAPWRSIAYALNHIPFDSGNTLKLSAGTFVENSILYINGGITLEGAGSNATLIQVNSYFNLTTLPATRIDQYGKHYDPKPDKFVIQINGNNITMKGFAMNGQANACHGAIRAKVINNAVFDDLTIYDYNFSGLWMQVANNTEIKNCHFTNNAYGNTVRSFGNIMYMHGKDLRIHDNVIIQKKEDYSSYGMSSYSQETNVFFGGNVGSVPKVPGSPEITCMTNLKIYNNHIEVPEKGGWNNFQSPAITIETNGTRIINMEVYNNWLNNHVSITPDNDAYDLTFGKKSVRIYNNAIDLGINEVRYAVEANAPKMEIDHNYIIGGYYPIAQWQTNRDNAIWDDHNIHHNVFYAPKDGQALIRYLDYPTHFRFNNNTVYETSKAGISEYIMKNDATTLDATGNEVANNIFISEVNHINDKWLNGASPTYLKVTNNLFYKTTTFGLNTVIADSVFSINTIIKNTGSIPTPYFELADSSPAIDAGNASFSDDPYYGSAPDLGAFEKLVGSGAGTGFISFPLTKSEIPIGSTIPVTITTTGTIRGVELFLDGVSQGKDLVSPYVWNINLNNGGQKILVAKITNQDGIVMTTPMTLVYVKIVNLGAAGIFSATSDIGLPTPVGSTTYFDAAKDPYKSDNTSGTLATYSIKGGGHTLSTTSDSFHYAYDSLRGDVVFSARILELTGSGVSGIMVRKNLAVDAPFIMLGKSTTGLYLISRTSQGGATTNTRISTTTASSFVRLSRQGNLYIPEYSLDGSVWTQPGSSSMSFDNAAFYGLSVISSNTGDSTLAKFDLVNLKVKQLGEFDHFNDAGSFTAPSFASFTNNEYHFLAEGKAGAYFSGKFTGAVAYKKIKGDFSVVTKVDRMERPNNQYSGVGIMLQDPAAPDQRYAYVQRRGDKVSYFKARDVAYSISGYEELLSASWNYGKPWIRLDRIGRNVQMFLGDDGKNWTSVSKVYDLSLPEEVNIGIAVNSSVPGAYAEAILTDFKINLYNINVALTAPGQNAVSIVNDTLQLKANAGLKGNGIIQSLKFYAADQLIGEDDEAPYEISWPLKTAGDFDLYVVASDANGNLSTSAKIKVSVLGTVPSSVTIDQVTTAEVDQDFPTLTDQYGSPTVPVGDPSATNDVQAFKSASGSADRESYVKFNLEGLNFTQINEALIIAKAGQHDTGTKVNPYWIEIYSCVETNWSRADLTWNKAATFTIGTQPLAVINIQGYSEYTWNSVSLTEYIKQKINAGAKEIAFKLKAKETQPFDVWMGGAAAGFGFKMKINGLINRDKAVALTQPKMNDLYYAGDDINIVASAGAISGVRKVEFFQGNVKLGEDLSSPYTFIWKQVYSNTYQLYARVTDQIGGVAESAKITVTVQDVPLSGTTSLKIDQTKSNGWNFIGRYQFQQGTVDYVKISNGFTKGNYAIADAIKLVSPGQPDIIVDTEDLTGVQIAGQWSTNIFTFPRNRLNFRSASITGQNSVTFFPNIPKTAVYDLYMIWANASNNGMDVPVDIYLGEPLDSIVLKPLTDMFVGDTLSLTPIFKPTNAADKRARWHSDDTSIVTVDENGLLRAIGSGETVVHLTAIDGGITGQTTVRVGIPWYDLLHEISLRDLPIAYPNPSCGNFHLYYNSSSTALLKIYNRSGFVVFSKSITSNELIETDLSQGQYILTVEYDGGVHATTLFVVK